MSVAKKSVLHFHLIGKMMIFPPDYEIWHGNASQFFAPCQPLKFLEFKNSRQRMADI